MKKEGYRLAELLLKFDVFSSFWIVYEVAIIFFTFFPPSSLPRLQVVIFECFGRMTMPRQEKMNEKKMNDASQYRQQQSENQCKSKDARKTTDVSFESSTKMYITEAHSMHFKKMHIFCMCLEKESGRLANGKILKTIKKEPSAL